MPLFTVTFGTASTLRGRYAVVEAPDYVEATRHVYRAIGPDYAGCYDEAGGAWARERYAEVTLDEAAATIAREGYIPAYT